MDRPSQSSLLVIDEKDKLKWRGNFEEFEYFVEDILQVVGKWNVPGGGSRQITNEEIRIRLYDNGSVTLLGPKAKEINEKLRDMVVVCKLNCKEFGLVNIASTSSTNELNKLDQDQTCNRQTSLVNESLLNTVDERAVSNISKNTDAEVNSELMNVLPLEIVVKDMQTQLNALNSAFENYRSEASIVLTDLVSNQESLSESAVSKHKEEISQLRYENTILKDENKALCDRLEQLRSQNAERLNYSATSLENMTEELNSLRSRQKDMEAIIRKQEGIISKIHEDNTLFKSKLLSCEALNPMTSYNRNDVDSSISEINNASKSSIVVSDQNKNCASVSIIKSVGKSLCLDDKQSNHLNILSTSSTEDLPRNAVSTVYDAPVDFKEKNIVDLTNLSPPRENPIELNSKGISPTEVSKEFNKQKVQKSATKGQFERQNNRIKVNQPGNFPKKLTPCPFLSRRGWCVKGNRCDFQHP